MADRAPRGLGKQQAGRPVLLQQVQRPTDQRQGIRYRDDVGVQVAVQEGKPGHFIDRPLDQAGGIPDEFEAPGVGPGLPHPFRQAVEPVLENQAAVQGFQQVKPAVQVAQHGAGRRGRQTPAPLAGQPQAQAVQPRHGQGEQQGDHDLIGPGRRHACQLGENAENDLPEVVVIDVVTRQPGIVRRKMDALVDRGEKGHAHRFPAAVVSLPVRIIDIGVVQFGEQVADKGGQEDDFRRQIQPASFPQILQERFPAEPDQQCGPRA